jgi:hypothetical protein
MIPDFCFALTVRLSEEQFQEMMIKSNVTTAINDEQSVILSVTEPGDGQSQWDFGFDNLE